MEFSPSLDNACEESCSSDASVERCFKGKLIRNWMVKQLGRYSCSLNNVTKRPQTQLTIIGFQTQDEKTKILIKTFNNLQSCCKRKNHLLCLELRTTELLWTQEGFLLQHKKRKSQQRQKEFLPLQSFKNSNDPFFVLKRLPHWLIQAGQEQETYF